MPVTCRTAARAVAVAAAILVGALEAAVVTGQSPTGGVRRPAPVWRHDVVRSFPHDAEAFTQGLVIRDGALFESTGLNGRSSLRRVDLTTGKVQKLQGVDRRYFAEGLAAWGPHLVQLTWDTGIAFVYDRATFGLVRTFSYAGEGWGLTDDGRQLVMSDGTATLRFLDPETFTVRRRVFVNDAGQPVERLNELEMVDGLVLANVWLTHRIAAIDPTGGAVVGWLDMAALSPRGANADAVLNGIAYDSSTKRLFITGKLWPRLYEIRIHRPS